jgi:hypothetical protein
MYICVDFYIYVYIYMYAYCIYMHMYLHVHVYKCFNFMWMMNNKKESHYLISMTIFLINYPDTWHNYIHTNIWYTDQCTYNITYHNLVSYKFIQSIWKYMNMHHKWSYVQSYKCMYQCIYICINEHMYSCL